MLVRPLLLAEDESALRSGVRSALLEGFVGDALYSLAIVMLVVVVNATSGNTMPMRPALVA